MVEINNQRKAFLDMLAWSGGTDNGRRENQKSWLWRHCRRRAIYWLLWCPRKLVTLGKTQINGRRTLPASFPLVGYYTATAEDFRKVRTLWHCSRLRSAAHTMIDRGDIRQAVDRCSNIWASCRALVMVSSSIRLTAWLQNSKKRAERSGDWCMSRVTAIISALVICIIVCLSWSC